MPGVVPSRSPAPAEAPPVLARSLTKIYGRRVGCLEVDLLVPRGSVFALLGPNGAGKSTLVRLLLGLLRPTAGEALLFGQPPGPRALQRVGYLPEQFRYQEWATPEEILGFHAALLGLPIDPDRARRALQRAGIADASRVRVGNFSKGMQQRLGLAVALLGDPDLVFLDEPTSALDPVGRKEVRELLLELRGEGKTVFLNSHLLTEVEAVADHVALMREGRIVAQGSLEQLLGPGHLELRARMDGELSKDLGEAARPLGWELLSIDRAEPQGVFSVRFRAASPSGEERVAHLVGWLVGKGAEVFEVRPRRRTLEDLFLELVGGGNSGQGGGGDLSRSAASPDLSAASGDGAGDGAGTCRLPRTGTEGEGRDGETHSNRPGDKAQDAGVFARPFLRGTWAVAAFTFREMGRRRLLGATLLLTLGFLLLFWLAARAAGSTASDLEPTLQSLLTVQMLATGIYFGGLLTAFLAAFSTVGALSGEVESGLMLAVAARPVPRGSMVGGKFLGYGLFVSLYASLLYLALLLVLRRELATSLPLELRSLAVFALQPLLVAALGLAASSLLPTTAAGVAAASAFALALVGGTVEQVGALVGNETMRRIGILSSLLLPTDSLYRLHASWLLGHLPPSLRAARAVLGPLGPVSAPSSPMLLYALLYGVACLLLAARRFSHRDL